MEGDIVQMGAYIGAGLACTGMGGAAVGVGHVVGNFLSGALRNPSAATGQTATMFIGIAFAEALGLENSYFDRFINNPISALRALHYPETNDFIIDKQQRAGAHTDYGSLTILLPQAGTSGLQIKKKNTWVDVPALEDCFVINIGDLMELWTAKRWISTLHRVVAKPNQPARKSLAYFHQPDWEATIKPISNSSSEAVVSGPYLMEKFKSTNL